MRKHVWKLLAALTLGLGPPVLGQTPSSQQPVAAQKNVPAFAEMAPAPAPPPPAPPAVPSTPKPAAPENLPPLPQQITVKLVADPTPPAQPIQAAPPQSQAFTISVTPASSPAPVPAQPAVVVPPVTTTAIQTVSYPGPFRNLVGNIGEALARSKMTRVTTYVAPPQIQVQALQAPVQAVTATPQTYVHRKCFQWFQP